MRDALVDVLVDHIAGGVHIAHIPGSRVAEAGVVAVADEDLIDGHLLAVTIVGRHGGETLVETHGRPLVHGNRHLVPSAAVHSAASTTTTVRP